MQSPCLMLRDEINFYVSLTQFIWQILSKKTIVPFRTCPTVVHRFCSQSLTGNLPCSDKTEHRDTKTGEFSSVGCKNTRQYLSVRTEEESGGGRCTVVNTTDDAEAGRGTATRKGPVPACGLDQCHCHHMAQWCANVSLFVAQEQSIITQCSLISCMYDTFKHMKIICHGYSLNHHSENGLLGFSHVWSSRGWNWMFLPICSSLSLTVELTNVLFLCQICGGVMGRAIHLCGSLPVVLLCVPTCEFYSLTFKRLRALRTDQSQFIMRLNSFSFLFYFILFKQ